LTEREARQEISKIHLPFKSRLRGLTIHGLNTDTLLTWIGTGAHFMADTNVYAGAILTHQHVCPRMTITASAQIHSGLN
jgi:hypothetical protein